MKWYKQLTINQRRKLHRSLNTVLGITAITISLLVILMLLRTEVGLRTELKKVSYEADYANNAFFKHLTKEHFNFKFEED